MARFGPLPGSAAIESLLYHHGTHARIRHLRGRRVGLSVAEIREIIQVYKDPPGEAGQLRLLMRKVEEKREELRQKRKDIDDTLTELDNIEDSCLARLAEIGVRS